MALLRWLTFPDCDSHSHALLGLFPCSEASICSTMAFSPLGNSDHVVVSVSTDFPSNSQRDAPFHRGIPFHPVMTILVVIGMVFVII